MNLKPGDTVKLRWTDDDDHTHLIGQELKIVRIFIHTSPNWVEVKDSTGRLYAVRGDDCILET